MARRARHHAGAERGGGRGEPPGRPNPRLKPHSEAFLLHIKPTDYHESVTRFTHTFRLGLLSTYLIIGYVGTIVPILGLGWLSDAIGLTRALGVFCGCLAALTALMGVVAWRARVLPVPRQ